MNGHHIKTNGNGITEESSSLTMASIATDSNDIGIIDSSSSASSSLKLKTSLNRHSEHDEICSTGLWKICLVLLEFYVHSKH